MIFNILIMHDAGHVLQTSWVYYFPVQWLDLGTKSQPSKLQIFDQIWQRKTPQLAQVSCMIYFCYENECAPKW